MMRLLLPLLAAGLSMAQSYTFGPQVLTFLSDVDDSDQPYALYLPKGYDPARKYPLVVSLHGASSNHRLNLRRVFGRGNQPTETDAEATRYFPPLRPVEFIVASPYARGTMGYQGIPEKDVWDVLADVKRRFNIDEDRVYLTGLSMGGGGTLWLGLTHPDVWAAIAPVCAAAPRGAEELAGNALNVPVHLFHGDQDPAVKVESSRTPGRSASWTWVCAPSTPSIPACATIPGTWPTRMALSSTGSASSAASASPSVCASPRGRMLTRRRTGCTSTA